VRNGGATAAQIYIAPCHALGFLWAGLVEIG
jgi:hypothetical protein